MVLKMQRDSRMITALLLAVASVLALFVFPTAAHAFATWTEAAPGNPIQGATCPQCHSTTSAGDVGTWDGSGPHANYSTTTSKCKLCHDVHVAPDDSILLLRGATVSQTCLMCHDGTGSGIGPYDAIEAHGQVVVGEHSVEVTNIIPGGSTPLSGTLSCGDCHSVHGSNTVAPFLRDTGRAYSPDAYVTSDCLLRNDVASGVVGSTPEYGAKWCASCHDQRHSGAALVNNHPVDSDAAWGYGDVQSTIDPAVWWQPALAGTLGLGRTNSGYIMAPVPSSGDGRIELANRRSPMCQQCHEDERDVEGTFSADYTFRGTDEWNTPVNPAFVTFPHQTTSANLLVEEWDDLCLNCHAVAELP